MERVLTSRCVKCGLNADILCISPGFRRHTIHHVTRSIIRSSPFPLKPGDSVHSNLKKHPHFYHPIEIQTEIISLRFHISGLRRRPGIPFNSDRNSDITTSGITSERPKIRVYPVWYSYLGANGACFRDSERHRKARSVAPIGVQTRFQPAASYAATACGFVETSRLLYNKE